VAVGLIDPQDAAEMRRESRTRMAEVWYDVMTTKQRRPRYRFSARELGAMLPGGPMSTQMPEEMREFFVGLAELQERGELEQPLRLGLEERRLMTGRKTVANIRAEEARMESLMPGLPRKFLTRPYKKPKKEKKSEGGKKTARGKRRKRKAGSSSSSSEVEKDSSSSSDEEGGDDDMEYKGKGLMLFNLDAAPDTPVSPDQVLEIWPMQILKVGGVMIQRSTAGMAWHFDA
jgi:hypothetical protein